MRNLLLSLGTSAVIPLALFSVPHLPGENPSQWCLLDLVVQGTGHSSRQPDNPGQAAGRSPVVSGLNRSVAGMSWVAWALAEMGCTLVGNKLVYSSDQSWGSGWHVGQARLPHNQTGPHHDFFNSFFVLGPQQQCVG